MVVHEILSYLARVTAATPSQIARDTGLPRYEVLGALHALEELGLVRRAGRAYLLTALGVLAATHGGLVAALAEAAARLLNGTETLACGQLAELAERLARHGLLEKIGVVEGGGENCIIVSTRAGQAAARRGPSTAKN